MFIILIFLAHIEYSYTIQEEYMIKKLFLSSLFFITHCTTQTESCAAPQNVIQCQTPILDNVDNLDTVKKEIKNFKKSGAWEESHSCIAEKAKAILNEYIPVGTRKLAVIFDIDDTALSNYEINIKQDFGFMHAHNKAWEMTSQSKPILPVLDFYNYAKSNGFAVFFITGRSEYQRESTITNLQQAGFCNWDGLFFKPPNYKKKSNCYFKSDWRKHIQSLGYTIIVNIGDQFSDMAGEAQALYNFKLSNPMYLIP